MRKDEFIEFVKRPETLSCDKTKDLQELLKRFPWFQSAQILLCRNLKTCGNIGFEEQLRLSAAYAGDRVRLHQLVMEPDKSAEVEVKQQEASGPKLAILPVIQRESSNSRSAEQLGEKEKTSEVDKKEFPQPTKETAPKQEEDFLDRQMLSHAISNSNLLEDVEMDEEIKDLPAHIKLEKLPSEQLIEEIPEKEVSTGEKKGFDESTEHSFTEWLQHFDDPDAEQEETIYKIEDDKKDLLVSNRQKTSFYNPTEMAKLSVKEDDDLITETLAKIYAQQGNFEKAIKSYNKLSLKYPEKKVYFASRIRELENQIQEGK